MPGWSLVLRLENGFDTLKGYVVQGLLQRIIIVTSFAGGFAWIAGAEAPVGAQTVRLSPPLFASGTAATEADASVESSPTPTSADEPRVARLAPEIVTLPAPSDTAPDNSAPTDTATSTNDSPTEFFAPWWTGGVSQAIHSPQQHMGITLEALLLGALQHSAQIRIISEQPLIRENAIVEAEAEFDWVRFLDNRYDDTSDPVSTSLQTGNSFNRYRNNQWTMKGGIRRKNLVGGRFEASQQLGFQNTNSVFFVPQDQGTARLRLSYTQPILRGRGTAYNRSLIVLAQLDTTIARDEFSQQLQGHLVDVTEAYWTLYLERAGLLQKQRLYDRAAEVLRELELRRDLDAQQSQLLKARAALATRGSELVRSRAEVLNTERKIRLLVNDPQLDGESPPELVPMEHPPQSHIKIEEFEIFETAVRHRPEIDMAMQRVRQAGVRLQIAKNELLPELNMILETYVAGLRGRTDIPNAWVDQFQTGQPGYGVGLQYEMPIGNRAARARHQQKLLEMRQMRSEFQLALETIRYEVEVSLRNLNTSYREMQARYKAVEAAEAEMQQLADRWRLLPGDDRSASLLLEDLLESQQRLNDSEYNFLQSQLNYSLAQMTIKQAMGTLLEDEQIQINRVCAPDGPMLAPDKP